MDALPDTDSIVAPVALIELQAFQNGRLVANMPSGDQEDAELPIFLDRERLNPLQEGLNIGPSFGLDLLKPLTGRLDLLDIAKLSPVVPVDVAAEGHQGEAVVLVELA